MAKTTTYTPEYKREIVKLVTEKGKTRAEVAESIGVSRTTINEWVKKYKEHGNDAFPGKGHLLPLEEAGLTSRLRRKFKATTNSNHNYPIAPNLLKQDFVSVKPNEKWVGDITYIATEEGWLYLATVQDLYTKKIVGWALGSRITKELTIRAMEQAIKKERPAAGLISHSDRGSQYAAYDYQDMLRRNKIRQSMSRKGNCYDNACAESFFANLKKDIIHGVRFTTRAEAKTKIVEYIEMFYNCTRIHSSIGDMSPIEFENMYYTSVAAYHILTFMPRKSIYMGWLPLV